MQIDPKVKKILGLEKVNQVGIVVRDMDKTINNMKIGLAMMGELQIELIQPLEGKTIYDEFLEKWGNGIHHLGFRSKICLHGYE